MKILSEISIRKNGNEWQFGMKHRQLDFREGSMLKKAKLIKIGNSQGIRLPKEMISRYGFGERVIL